MKVELVISMNEKGEVKMTGPIEQKILCYGLLEFAKEIVQNYQASPITLVGTEKLMTIGGK